MIFNFFISKILILNLSVQFKNKSIFSKAYILKKLFINEKMKVSSSLNKIKQKQQNLIRYEALNSKKINK